MALAIIFILAAMLLPVFEQAIKQAESVSCLANVRSLSLAALMYVGDYDGRLPPALMPGPLPGTAVCWDRLLVPYLAGAGSYLCPADPNPTPGPSWTYSLPHSYGINLALTMPGGYLGTSLSFDHLQAPAATILFFELQQPYSYGWEPSWGQQAQYLSLRHRQGSNFAYCAGNARWLDEAGAGHLPAWLP